MVCEDEKQAVAVKSQLQQIGRPMYSNPPVHGALIVSTILGDPELKKLWLKEVKVSHYHLISCLHFSLIVFAAFFIKGPALFIYLKPCKLPQSCLYW